MIKFQTKENTEALQKEKGSVVKHIRRLSSADIDTDYRNKQKIFRSIQNICIF